MPNRYYSDVTPPDHERERGGRMAKHDGNQTDDGRLKGKSAKASAKFEHQPGDPNMGVKKLGHRKGKE